MVRAAGPASADAEIIGDAGAGVLEAVEVKNTCPFQQVSWVTASGKRRTSYVLRDRGPRAEARGVLIPIPKPIKHLYLCRLIRSLDECSPCS